MTARFLSLSETAEKLGMSTDDILRLVDILDKAISINPQSSVLYAFRAFVKDSYFRFFTDDNC